MREQDGTLLLAATDLSNHVACPHLTTLNKASARGEIGGYTNFDPLLKILQERGQVHEASYVDYLRASGKRVESGGRETFRWMSEGVDVITQGSLERDTWSGRADFLIRVERPSPRWSWSYEVIDTKLSSETRAGAVLQLCVYSDLLGTLQGLPPEYMHVVKPGQDFPRDSFRFEEFGAIYRALRGDLEQRLPLAVSTYPEPTAHCDVCNWRSHCEQQRRTDDHLSLVADLGRTHQRELERHDVRTLTVLAQQPTPWRHEVDRGSAATFERLTQQARLQLMARGQTVPPFELLPVEPERGLHRLPAPSAGDIFLDFEGDPFIGEHGREYMFGWHTADRGYEVLWAPDDASERRALEQFIGFVMDRWATYPDMHVYHYAPYEPTALKRMAGRYATCSEELDRLLRGKRLIDLYSITKQTARIGIESYSIKYLEPLIGYQRPAELGVTGPSVRAVKLALQRGVPGAILPAWQTHVELYNRGDCESAAVLRDWLEARRAELVQTGIDLPRPPLQSGEVESVTEVRTAAAATAARLLLDISDNREERTEPQQAQWLLGQLMEWYRREDKVTWWEFFRLAETSEEDRLDEQKAISGLEQLAVVDPGDGRRNAVIRYRYPPQELFLGERDELQIDREIKVGSVVSIDPSNRTVDIKRARKTRDLSLTSVFTHKYINPKPKDLALVRVGSAVADQGFPAEDRPSLVRDLLLRAPPRGLAPPGQPLRRAGESIHDCAIRLALALDGAVLPMQGPPGTGKTTTAAEMIVELVLAGRRVGVTATSHAVIENLVTKAVDEAIRRGRPLQAVLKCDEPDDTQHPGIFYTNDAADADARMPQTELLGATPWQWARETMRNGVDVLFIDEAGQMCLADAVSVCESARSLVLVGDPQQLEQPIQGTHPDGVAVSALQHVLGSAQTIPAERGLFLDQTHRLHPSICTFTSEQFYEGRLVPGPNVGLQGLATEPLVLPGLFWLPIPHEGNQNRSVEEAAAVADLVARCLTPPAFWTSDRGNSRPLTEQDVLIVAPYNAHVAEIRDALRRRGIPDVAVGTVDKFQGQQAAIAIYSMATSRPEHAPRGLSFLYDRHRLNVATSRARCASILVANPALLRPACSTPVHLHLASALARFVELSSPLVAR